MRIRIMLLGAVLACGSYATAVDAKVSRAEANKLGKALTPFGSIIEGNAAGTIPSWTGGISKPPEGFEIGRAHV